MSGAMSDSPRIESDHSEPYNRPSMKLQPDQYITRSLWTGIQPEAQRCPSV